MSDRPVFDRTRSGQIINSEAEYYNSIFSEPILSSESDEDYFDSYYRRQKSANTKIDSDESDDSDY